MIVANNDIVEPASAGLLAQTGVFRAGRRRRDAERLGMLFTAFLRRRYSRIRGSSTSRKPSPMKLMQSTVTRIITPG
jgi:hypothetical protein